VPYDDIRIFQGPGTVVAAWRGHDPVVLVCDGRWGIPVHLDPFSLITTGIRVLAVDSAPWHLLRKRDGRMTRPNSFFYFSAIAALAE